VSERLAEFGFTDQRDLDLIREDVRFTLPPELATIAPARAVKRFAVCCTWQGSAQWCDGRIAGLTSKSGIGP